MKKLISTIFLISVFAVGIFLYLRNADVDINYERFKMVGENFIYLKDQYAVSVNSEYDFKYM